MMLSVCPSFILYANWRVYDSLIFPKVNIADATEQQWVTCFQETAETLLGKYFIGWLFQKYSS